MKNVIWKITIVSMMVAMGCWTWIVQDMQDSIRCLRSDDQAVINYMTQLVQTQYENQAILQEQINLLDPQLAVAKGLSSVVIIHGATGHGSGFFIDKKNGIILTAGHVAQHDDQEQLYVKLGSVDVPILNACWDSFSDVGLVFIDPIQAQRFSAENVALSSTPVQIGDMLISAGYPLDMNDTPYASVGIVVNPDMNDAALEMGLKFGKLVKFHLEVIPGMSGGPILNAVGEAVSMNCIAMGGTQISCGPSGDQIFRAIKRLMRERSHTVHVRPIPVREDSEDSQNGNETEIIFRPYSI